jgi:glycosyltransferase involved in cell wall biosynthesis
MLPSVFATMLARRAEFDLVFSPDYRGIGIAGILAARLLGRSVVMSTAALGVISVANADPLLARVGLGPRNPLARLAKWPLRRIYTSVDAYAAITHAIAREAVEAGVPTARVHYLPNSVDTTRFRPPIEGEAAALRAELDWPIDRTIVLFLARLSREKGLMDLLDAWWRLSPREAQLDVAGPDMPGHPFDVGAAGRAWVAERRLGDSIRFVGPTSTPERLLRAADVVVQPSHWEAAPFGVIEAIASGRPVVATAVGGMAEYLVDGENALLCPPQSPSDLTAALARLLPDRGLQRRLGAAGRDLAEREFDERIVCARYASLFESVAGSRGRTS